MLRVHYSPFPVGVVVDQTGPVTANARDLPVGLPVSASIARTVATAVTSTIATETSASSKAVGHRYRRRLPRPDWMPRAWRRQELRRRALRLKVKQVTAMTIQSRLGREPTRGDKRSAAAARKSIARVTAVHNVWSHWFEAEQVAFQQPANAARTEAESRPNQTMQQVPSPSLTSTVANVVNTVTVAAFPSEGFVRSQLSTAQSIAVSSTSFTDPAFRAAKVPASPTVVFVRSTPAVSPYPVPLPTPPAVLAATAVDVTASPTCSNPVSLPLCGSFPSPVVGSITTVVQQLTSSPIDGSIGLNQPTSDPYALPVEVPSTSAYAAELVSAATERCSRSTSAVSPDPGPLSDPSVLPLASAVDYYHSNCTPVYDLIHTYETLASSQVGCTAVTEVSVSDSCLLTADTLRATLVGLNVDMPSLATVLRLSCGPIASTVPGYPTRDGVDNVRVGGGDDRTALATDIHMNVRASVCCVHVCLFLLRACLYHLLCLVVL
jgi:hypothetical protein